MNSKKPAESAMKKTINRSALLGRASSMTVAAAAAATASIFGAADAHAACFETTGPLPSVILSSPRDCVIIDDPIDNNVIVNTDVLQNSTDPAFLVTDTIGGRLRNNGIISNTGGESGGVALSIRGGYVAGGITNTGQILSDSDTAIWLSYGGSAGGLKNEGEISGFIGIDATEGFQIDGGIINDEDALIDGDAFGIRIYEKAYNYYGSPSLNGNISNRGTIEGGSTAILISTEFTSASINNENSGVIRATDEYAESSIAIHIASGDAFMDLNNAGHIHGVEGGFLFSGDNFDGDINNSGEITSDGTVGAVRLGIQTGIFDFFYGSSVSGSLTNSGLIDGGEGWGVVIEAEEISRQSLMPSAIPEVNEAGPLDIFFDDPYRLVNRGEIHGGVRLSAIEASVDILNRRDGLISSVGSGGNTGLVLTAFHMFAEVRNDGRIEGSSVGMAVACDPVFGCKNPADLFSAEVSPLDAPLSSPVLFADISNRGLIQGGETGLRVGSALTLAFISNSGTISGTIEEVQSPDEQLLAQDFSRTTGLLIDPDAGNFCVSEYTECFEGAQFYGNIDNSGLITGSDGVTIRASTFAAWDGGSALLNSGDIVGTAYTGLRIDVSHWYGDIINSGLIHGADTGVHLYGETFEGDFVNDGDITGGQLTTGLHIEFSSFTGNVVNNVLLSAPGNALHIEVDTFAGSITNSGTVLATALGGTAVRLENFYGSGYYSGGFTNTGLIEGGGDGAGIRVEVASLFYGIVNDGGTITADDAIDTRDSLAGMEILNKGGGFIDGNLRLSEDHADGFIGEDGGIRGDIEGDGSEGGYDDWVVVRDGDHYFIGEARNLVAFTVQSGGTAFMGATGEYASFEVSSLSSPDSFYGYMIDTLEVQEGARLYLGTDADFEVGSYTQDPNGELTFLLTANESEHGQIRNPVAGGSVQIAGTISVDLDLSSFAGESTNQFTYEDVIVSESLSGSFVNQAVIGSPFFELDVIRNPSSGEGDPGSIDLRLTRASFASLSCSTSTENNEALGQMLEDAFQAGDLTEDQLALYLAILNSPDSCSVSSTYQDLSGTPFDFIAFQLDGPFKKMVGARIDSGRATGCIVAGSADCFNRYAADTTAGSNVMNDATPGGDPFAWLRSGIRKEGTSAVWGRGVGVWGETDGDDGAGAPGSRFNQRGGIVGADHVFTETLIAGVAAQYTDTDIKFPGRVDRVSVGSYEFGAYASYGDTQGYLNANASYIWHSFDTYRQVMGSDTRGAFDGGTVSALVELGRIYEADGWRIQPVGMLSFASLSTDGYTETGTSLSRLVVKDSGFDSLKSILGGRIAYPVEMESGRRWVPEVRVSWSHEFMDNSAEFDARLFSFAEDPSSYFTTRGAEYDRDALILGAGMNAPINEKIIVYLDYDTTLSSDQTSHTASGGLRILW